MGQVLISLSDCKVVLQQQQCDSTTIIFMHNNNNNQYHNIMFIKDIEDDGGESGLG